MSVRVARLRGAASLLLLAACSALVACSQGSDDAQGTAGACPGPFCGTAGAASGDAGSTEGAAFDGPAGATRSPLCGAGGCDPDWASACVEPGSGGVEGDAGDDATPLDATPGLPYPPGAPSPSPSPDDAAAPDAGAPASACHVHRSPSGLRSTCEASGAALLGDACATSHDCGAGLACMGLAGGGSCRPYCCGDPEACPAATFCAPRPLAEDASSPTPLLVPACVPADGCELLHVDACPASLACAIVRADGTTSCVSPGGGRRDESCPCAEGYVCAKSANVCLKLCHTGLGAAECPGGTCQGGSGAFPPGFGVCVGSVGDAG